MDYMDYRLQMSEMKQRFSPDQANKMNLTFTAVAQWPPTRRMVMRGLERIRMAPHDRAMVKATPKRIKRACISQFYA